MFYCVLKDNKVNWHSGIIDFPLCNEDIRIMYKEENNEEFDNGACKIFNIQDRDLINNIMTKEVIWDGSEWIVNDIELTPNPTEYNIEEELFNTQTQLLQSQIQNQELGQQLFDLQTLLISQGVI